jgi:hypothetical protein
MNKILLVIIPVLLIIGCDKIPSGVSDPKPNDYQVVKIVAPSEFFYTTANKILSTSVQLSTSENVSSVWLNIYSSDGTQLNSGEFILKDDGNWSNGDFYANDNIYSGQFELKSEYPIGQYRIDYFVDDNAKNSHLVAVHYFMFDKEQVNVPPFISNLSAPDSIKLTGAEMFFTITLEVADSNGQNDIKQVFFNSYLPPDGRPSSQNPILLYDNGTNGDKVPNDGTYSVTIQLPATGVATGVYRWEFQAMDRSDSLSNKIIHNVVIL